MYHMYKGALGRVPRTHSNSYLQRGSLIGNNIQHTSAIVGLGICAKGLLQVTAMSFISVFIFGAALSS